MKLTIVHLEGSKQGLTETLSGDVITIGRDPSNSLSFDPFKDLDVSARHASVSVQGETAVLQDLGSTNGTFLNGGKVEGAIPLPNGCIVQFGEKGPKLQLTWTLHEGPGKKTQMIHDLSSKLDEEGAARKKEKKKGLIIVLIVLLLGIGTTVGLMVHSSSSAQAKLSEDVAKQKKRAEQERSSAETQGANVDAKAEWDEALAAMSAAAKAEEAGELQSALDGYIAAFDAFQKAGKVAGTAALTKLKAQLEQASKQAQASLKEKEAKDKADRARLENETKERMAKLKAQLEAAQKGAKAKEILAALEGIDMGDEQQLNSGIVMLTQAMTELPEDIPERSQLDDRLAEMIKAKEDLGKVSERLQAGAKAAKPGIVAIKTHVYALPKGQSKETTKIRVSVAEAAGTGFFASGDGKVVTAKEVVYPDLFDPKAAALRAKLEERGMQFFRDLEILTYDEGEGAYTTVVKANEESVARKFDDAWAPKQKVTIPFDNAEVEVTVRPHERGDTDVVVLQLDGVKDAKALEVSSEAIEESLPIVVLGTQKGDDDEKLGLFMFEGTAKEGTRVLTLVVPAFSSWIGGPLLNADGKVVGILTSPDLKESKGVAAAVFAPALE